jgi:hypothetical protein
MTWEALVALDPGLRVLEREARMHARLDRLKRQLLRHEWLLPAEVQRWAQRSCANDIWYRPGGLKQRMANLVGHGARNPALKSSEAYDVAYEHLYALLPDCRNCWCG